MKPRHTRQTKVGRRTFLTSAAASASVLSLTRGSATLEVGAPPAGQSRGDYFTITVVDEESGRGVPLVELKLTNSVRYFTDSNGIVAFYEPGLMEREVWFSIQSAGYEIPKNAYDERGKAVKTIGGGTAVVKIQRINIAERIYRLTGEGIYRDSVLVGAPVPLKQPLLNAEVMGQDTVETAVYRGKIYWFFGDTEKPSFPLGNFGTSGATSELPGRGGLDPSVGVNLDYFTDIYGFSKPMIPPSAVPGPGPKWTDAVMVVEDDHGVERMIAHYVRVKDLVTMYEQGLVIFNDKTGNFDRLAQFDLHLPVGPAGRPFRIGIAGKPFYYFPSPYAAPLVRVKADLPHIRNPKSYEGFTCLTTGGRYDPSSPQLDRATDGRLIYGWKPGTPPLTYKQQQELIAAGKMKPEEGMARLIDFDTGAEIDHTGGTVYWNDCRRRWVMITQRERDWGEVAYAEGDTPLGPWVYAKQIATHGHFTFYQPAHLPFFDQEGGRVIYFAGTYTNSFSGNPDQTPRYEYNQLIYQLNLEDPRIFLPVPIYRVKGVEGGLHYMTREGVDDTNAWDRIEAAPFFALSPGRAPEGLLPIFSSSDGRLYSQRTPGAVAVVAPQPLSYALPAEPLTSEQKLVGECKCGVKGQKGPEFTVQQDKSPAVVPLYEYRLGKQGTRIYSTDSGLTQPGLRRTAQPLCRVWRNPQSLLILDRHARHF